MLDGLALAAAVLGARETVLWLHEDSPALGAVAQALRERSTAGMGGPPVRVLTASATYLSGESSAIRRALAGGPLLPAPGGRARGPGAAVVHNVETLARVALVARGLPAAADAALVTVLDDGLRTVVEAAGRETVAEVLRRTRGVGGPSPQAVLLGGYAGTWLPWPSAGDLALAGPGRHAGTGAGLVAVLPQGACGLAETAAILGYLAGQQRRAVRSLPVRTALRRRPRGASRTGAGAARRRATAARRVGRDRRARRLLPPRRRRPHAAQRAGDLRQRRRAPPAPPPLRRGGRRPGAARAGAPVSARPQGALRLAVDAARCDGIGMCALVARRVVDLDAWGYPSSPPGRSRARASRRRGPPSGAARAARSRSYPSIRRAANRP